MMHNVLLRALVASSICLFGAVAFADNVTIHLYDLNGEVLRGSGGRHNSIIVYEQDRGSVVNNLADTVTATIPKLRTELGRVSDDDDDGILNVTIALPPSQLERAVVVVVQRFSETTPTATVPFVIISRNNSQSHVLHVAVPTAPMKAAVQPCYTCRHRLFFGRRCR